MVLKAEDIQEGQLILIDKPINWTSFDVVNFIRSFLRKIYGLKKLKVGHAGTLDPLATGLLILCTGKKTKQIDVYQGMDKSYVGSMRIGVSTPSYDSETEPDHFFEYTDLTIAQLEEARGQFLGEIDQFPPVYSAVKIAGKRAFDYARKDEKVVLKSRRVNIRQFSLLNIQLPNIDFSVECSKGTYIRSLVHDYGKALQNGAYLTALRRTRIGTFNVSEAYTIDGFRAHILGDDYENKD